MIVLGIWGFIQCWNEVPVSPTRSWLRRMWVASWMTVRRLKMIEGTCIALAVAVPWYLSVGLRTEVSGLKFFSRSQFGSSINSMEGHRGGWWFYPAASLVGLFPWSMLLIPIAIWTYERLGHHEKSSIFS